MWSETRNIPWRKMSKVSRSLGHTELLLSVCLDTGGERSRGHIYFVAMYLPSQLERTPQFFLVMVDDRVKGGGHAPPSPPSPGWAEFTIKMDCPPKSGHCLCSLVCS